jgi:hypothetical protein
MLTIIHQKHLCLLNSFGVITLWWRIVKGTGCWTKRGPNGSPVGQAHSNPILDTHEYEVEFTDGAREIYMANMIAENMNSQVDEEGQQYTLMSEIIDHKSDGKALSKDDGFYLDCYGKQQPRMTTCGWKLLVEWKDGNSS